MTPPSRSMLRIHTPTLHLAVIALFLTACAKEEWDLTTSETTTTTVPTSDLDCPDLQLNFGDTCFVESSAGTEPGGVAEDCTCVPDTAGETFWVEFVNMTAADVVVTVETSPPFLLGSTYVELAPVGAVLPYMLPLGTVEASVQAFLACPDIGVVESSIFIADFQVVIGDTLSLDVDCL